MGVTRVEAEFLNDNGTSSHTVHYYPYSDADLFDYLFRVIVTKSALKSGVSGNLYRLLAEYRLTERRARALENVILPEIDQSLREMSAHLEELDLEDAIRVRLQSNAMA